METLLRSDFEKVRQSGKFQDANVQIRDGSIFTWTLAIPGGKGTSWEGLVYDLEITFSRRHPFEPPRVDFPRTHRNVSNPGHPLVDGSGRLRMQKLSFDKWLPTIEASSVISWLYHLFETEPPCVTSGNRCPFTHLSSETILQVHTFLDAGDLGRLSQTGKHMLSLCFDEATWAKLYYRSCTSMDGLLGGKEGGACPVRVMGVSGKWFWEGSREAYIRSWEMRKACTRRTFSTARTQELHVMWELGGLMTVTAGLLSDITSRRFNMPVGAGNPAQLRHMECLLDSQTMRIASLQRLMAWPGVCRSLLCEKDEDSSSPAGRWDQRGVGGGGGGGGRPRLDGRGRFRPTPGVGVSLGGLGLADRSASSSPCPFSSPTSMEQQPSGTREPSGREARLTPEQRHALRLLCGNLAAFPVMPHRPGDAGAGAAAGGGGGGGGGGGSLAGGAGSSRAAMPCSLTPAGTPTSCFPHHHHTVSSPAIPYGMSRVELPSRDSWRNSRDGGGAQGDGGGGGGDGGGAAAGGAEGLVDFGGWNWLDFPGINPGSQQGGGGATLLNTQPACGMGGLCWPTLYDLTMAKRRQRERLRDCFRRFSPGQRLDVRDPAGVWMGAVVLWAPGGGSGDEWEDAADGAATAGAGAANAAAGGGAAAGAAGAGGAAAGGGGGAGGVGGHGALHAGGADHGTPEWRRLLQLALLADGGHLGMHANQVAAAGAAALAAAVGGNGNGPVYPPLGPVGTPPAVAVAAAAALEAENPAEPGSSVALTSGGDWVTTAAIDAAQSFLASAVSAAANSRPWPPPESPSPPSRTPAWSVSARRRVRPPGPTTPPPGPTPPPPPLPPNMQHGGPPGLATMMAAAQAAGAPPAFEVVVGGVQAGAPAAATAAAAAAAAGAPAAAAPAAGGGVPATALFTAGNVLGAGRKSVLIHYEGYKSRYDEWITVQSPRLAPFRSRTSRPLSVTMQSVERVVNGASVSAPRGVPAPDCVEVSLSCPWISHCAGGGVVTYRLPRTTILGAVLADFCHLAGISLRRATIQRAVLQLASDIRHGKCEVWELDDRRTLEYLKVTSGSVLLVCVVPATKDIQPACPPCVPPPPEISSYPGDDGDDGDGGGGGDDSDIGSSSDEEEEDVEVGGGGGAGSGGFNPASENASVPAWVVEGMAEEGEGGEAKDAAAAGGDGGGSGSVNANVGTESGVVAGSRSGAAASRASAPAQAAVPPWRAIRQRVANGRRAANGKGAATAQGAAAEAACGSGSGTPVRCSADGGLAAANAVNGRRGASDGGGAASESAGSAAGESRAGRFSRRRSRARNWLWPT